MKSVCTHYCNQTWTEVKVKTLTGKVYNVKSNTEIFTDKADPFVKVKYIITGWRKI
jgi:hypothetical protein